MNSFNEQNKSKEKQLENQIYKLKKINEEKDSKLEETKS